MRRVILVLAAVLLPCAASAWDGYDYEHGTYIEIEKGNLVRQGREIEIYEYGDGYRQVEVDSVRRYGSRVEIEVIDSETGQARTFTMDEE